MRPCQTRISHPARRAASTNASGRTRVPDVHPSFNQIGNERWRCQTLPTASAEGSRATSADDGSVPSIRPLITCRRKKEIDVLRDFRFGTDHDASVSFGLHTTIRFTSSGHRPRRSNPTMSFSTAKMQHSAKRIVQNCLPRFIHNYAIRSAGEKFILNSGGFPTCSRLVRYTAATPLPCLRDRSND